MRGPPRDLELRIPEMPAAADGMDRIMPSRRKEPAPRPPMSDFFDYEEVACPRCRHLNRRFGTSLLDGRHAGRCDRCGVDLATGRFSWSGAIDWALLVAMVFFLCGLIGALVALVVCHLLAWMMLGPRYDAVREGINVIAIAAGIAGGLVFAERKRRREGIAGPGRLVRDSPEAAAAHPSGRRKNASAVPESRAAVRSRTARRWYLGLGYAVGVLAGLAPVSWVLAALGRPELHEVGLGVSMVAGLAAGWAWGRWKHPPPASRDDAG